MNEDEAQDIVDSWYLDEDEYDIDGCVEDLMDGWDPDGSREEIIARNKYCD